MPDDLPTPLSTRDKGLVFSIVGLALLLPAFVFLYIATWAGADAHRWAATAGITALPGLICIGLGALLIEGS